MLQPSMAVEPSIAESKLDIEEGKASIERSSSEDVEKALEDPPTTTDATGQQEYPPMRRVFPIMASLYLATFLVSLVSYTARNTFRIALGADILIRIVQLLLPLYRVSSNVAEPTPLRP